MKEEFYELFAFVGYLYYDGRLNKRDVKKAFDLLNISADHNNSNALFLIGSIYYDGKYLPRNINKAIEYFELSSKLNNINSQCYLGLIYYQDIVDIGKSIYYFIS